MYLKYLPDDGDVSDATLFYPVILGPLEHIEAYYRNATSGAENAADAMDTQTMRQIHEL